MEATATPKVQTDILPSIDDTKLSSLIHIASHHFDIDLPG